MMGHHGSCHIMASVKCCESSNCIPAAIHLDLPGGLLPLNFIKRYHKLAMFERSCPWKKVYHLQETSMKVKSSQDDTTSVNWKDLKKKSRGIIEIITRNAIPNPEGVVNLFIYSMPHHKHHIKSYTSSTTYSMNKITKIGFNSLLMYEPVYTVCF